MRSGPEARLAALLEAGPPAGAYFLHGDAVRLRDEAAKRLVDAALDPSVRDFNLDLFRGDETEPEALAAALAMPPMMADHRVIHVSEAQGLSPTGRKVLQGAVEKLPPDLVLVITATIPSGSRAAFYRVLRERCRSLEWRVPREEALPGWLIRRARERHGTKLAREAAQALAAATGPDLSQLDAELEKLAAGGEEEVTLERVRELVPHTRRIDRWSWLDGVAERRYGPALRELDGVLAGDSPVGLLMAMVDQHLLLGVAVAGGVERLRRTLSDAGKGYLQWKAPVYARQSRRWTVGEIERALRLMLRADRRLKTGGEGRAVLEELLLGLRLLRRVAA